MFLKKNKLDNLEELPLNYWEEKSYFCVALPDDSFILSNIIKRVEKIKGLKIKSKNFDPSTTTLTLNVIYDNEEYEVGFFLTSINSSLFSNKKSVFTREEMEKLKNVKRGLTIYMEFSSDARKSYQLQLKIAMAIVPNTLAIIDESAEKIIPRRLAQMNNNSDILPSFKDLFSVQMDSKRYGSIWVHTHGLCRCHVTELEIIDNHFQNYISYFNIIDSFADYLIREKEKYEKDKHVSIGMFTNKKPIVVTAIPWVEGINMYDKSSIGGIKDRIDGHNTNTSIIFVYNSEEDIKNNVISKLDIYNELWIDNPIFYISDEETERMKSVAMERFDYVREYFNKKDINIDIKVGLVDRNGDYEHIWYNLLNIEGNKMKGRLLQEPYNIENKHMDDIDIIDIKDITDWEIYIEDYIINPNNVYLLEKIKEEIKL